MGMENMRSEIQATSGCLPYASNRRIHADVIVLIFYHLHTALGTEGNMLDMN